MITDTLTKLGLSENEALVYSNLLTHSPASAAYLAKKSNLARSSVYTALNNLTAKGLVGVSYKNEIKQFIVENLDSFGDLLVREKESLEKRIQLFQKEKPELEKLKAAWLKIPQIMTFEGQEGLKKVYLSMMREVEEDAIMYVIRNEFVWEPEWRFIFEKEWHQKVKDIKSSKHIQTKLLINNSKNERSHLKTYKQRKGLAVRLLPPQYNLKDFALYISGDTLSILSFEHSDMVGIKIVNKNLADNFMNIFQSLWTNSKPSK